MLNPLENDSISRFTQAEPTQYFGYSKPAFKSKLRLDQENAIMTDLQTGNAVLVRAFFRMGQTSMIRALENRFNPSFIRVDARSVYKKTLDDLKDEIDVGASAFLAQRNIQTQRQGALGYLSDYLRDQGETVLVAVNEGGALIHNPDQAQFVANIRHLSGICLAVQMPFMNAGEPVATEVFKEFITHKLRALRQDEVDMLAKGVTATLEPSATLTNGSLDRLFELSGGRPWDVIASCEYFFWEEKLKTDLNSHDVDRILKMGIANLNETYLRGPISVYEHIYRGVLSNNQRKVVEAVRKDGTFSAFTQMEEQSAQSLVDASWFKFDPVNGGYIFNGKLLTKTLTE